MHNVWQVFGHILLLWFGSILSNHLLLGYGRLRRLWSGFSGSLAQSRKPSAAETLSWSQFVRQLGKSRRRRVGLQCQPLGRKVELELQLRGVVVDLLRLDHLHLSESSACQSLSLKPLRLRWDVVDLCDNDPTTLVLLSPAFFFCIAILFLIQHLLCFFAGRFISYP